MSEGSKQEQRRRISEECKRDEEYNRMKRLKLLEKQKRNCNADPVDKASRKAEEKELIQQLRAERRRQSEDNNAESKKVLQFTARIRSTVDSESSAYDDESKRQKTDATSCPHKCVGRSEPLKAQLLEIIGNMSPDCKFQEERGHSYRADLQTPRRIENIIEETSDLIISSDSSANPDTKRAEISSRNPSSGSPLRLSPTYLVTEPQPIAGLCNCEEDSAPSARAIVMTPPTKRTQDISSPEGKTKCRICPATVPSKQKYRVYDITDASTSTGTYDEKQEDSQIAMSITNTIKLPSTSTAMREERTQEFLNEGWYHNVCTLTNDEFSSILGSSAHQINIHPHLQQQYMQNVQNIQSMQKMATSGPIICDRCRYETELLPQHSYPYSPALATQATIQMEQAGKQTVQPTATIQCDATYAKRNNFLRTIFNVFKNPLGRPTYNRPTFDPTVSELYRLNITEGNDYQGHPKRVIFDLIDGEMYRPTMATVGTNTHVGISHSPLVPQMGIVQPSGSNKLLFNVQPPPEQQCTYTDQECSPNTGAIVVNHPQGDQPSKNSCKQSLRRYQERIDVYYFDHGNASYYRTTDSPGTIYTELIAERIEHNTAQYWAELFGTIHIAFALFTAFFLQLYRFVLQSTFRPLTVGFVQLTSDYMIKPLLALLFNAIIQPILIYLYNIATSFRDLCEPIADSIGFFLREIAVLIRAFRLVEVKKHKNVRPFAEML